MGALVIRLAYWLNTGFSAEGFECGMLAGPPPSAGVSASASSATTATALHRQGTSQPCASRHSAMTHTVVQGHAKQNKPGRQALHSRLARAQTAQGCERRAPLHCATLWLLSACVAIEPLLSSTQPPRTWPSRPNRHVLPYSPN